MDKVVILAQDPSFRMLAFSLYDGEDTVFLDSCSFKFDKRIGFEEVFEANHDILNQYLKKLVNDYGVNKYLFIEKIFSEVPQPGGYFSPGLYSLDTFILDRLFLFNKRCNEIYTLPPNFLMTVHNARKWKKSDSTVLAKYLMENVLGDMFQYKYKGRLNSDMAESFLMLLRAFCKYDVKGCCDTITNAIPGFYSEYEKLLIKR